MIAMMGAVISAMARFVAAAGDRSGCSSITRSTFLTTTIASSTTMPMASTKHDLHRHALHHLGEIAHGIVRRKQRKGAAGALADQPLAHAVKGLQVELIAGLGGDEPHRRTLHRFGDRSMAPRLSRPMTWKEFLPIIDAIYGDCGVEFRRHSALLVFGAPCQRNLLAGQEHGRTIPLADYLRRTDMTKKLEGKVAVITGATSGMALATAKLFVEEGAYVFITGRRQEQLDTAVKEIGKNVTGVQGDAGNLADLDRLYDAVKAKKGISTFCTPAPVSANSTFLSVPSRRQISTTLSTSTSGARCSRFRRHCR